MKRAPLALCALLMASTAVGKRLPRKAQSVLRTLHVTTHLVQVNVIVLDHHGRPVSGLTRKDFKVFDGGKQEKITVFREVVNRPPAASAASLPLDTFSNLKERSGEVAPSVTVILLDALNTRFVDQSYARHQVMKFLGQLRPNDRVALYVLGLHLVVLHDFTSDAAPLLQALRRYQGQIMSEFQVVGSELHIRGGRLIGGEPGFEGDLAPPSMNDFLSRGAQMEIEHFEALRLKVTTNALVEIANHLAGLPGRKNLIWVSDSFPMWDNLGRSLRGSGSLGLNGVLEFRSEIERATRALNNVNLAIYPVDADGLWDDANFYHELLDLSSGGTHAFSSGLTAMKELARHTGGRAFYNSNDIMGSIRHVVDDSKVTYVLAYYPKGVKWKGEYRKIKVLVGRPGLRLQYRHGYAALTEKKATATTRKAAMAAAMVSPLDATGIGLTVRLVPESKGKNVRRGPFFLRVLVDPRDVNFKQGGGRWIARLTLVTDEIGSKGKSLKGISQKIDLHLKPETYRGLFTKGMGFHEQLPLPVLPNAERLRVIIRDDSTGLMGSVNVPLDRVMPRRG